MRVVITKKWRIYEPGEIVECTSGVGETLIYLGVAKRQEVTAKQRKATRRATNKIDANHRASE